MKNAVRTRKAQSAMEYLMTYGWAILIIAVVLGALFSLGVFSSGALLGTSCIALSGYLCSNPVLHSGSFTATIGQATGSSWTSAYLLFVGYGSSAPTSADFVGTNGMSVSGGISSGQSVTFTAGNYISSTGAVTALPTTIGTAVSGSIWAYYSTSSASNLITQIGTVTVKAS
jgi:hypothetical protein